MKTAILRERLAFAATVAVVMLASFRNNDAGDNRAFPLLETINNNSGTMLITYNQRLMISKLTRVQRTADETYVDVRIPVYQNGRLVSTLVSTHESGDDSQIFSSFDYAADYRQIEKIRYYADGEVQGYDSLVYNAAGRISARYFFSRAAGNRFEDHNHQLYTWDAAGNVSRMDNYGRTTATGNFALSSSVTYTYDAKPNPQKKVVGLCYITDLMPAFLSANNILTEEITGVNSAGKQINTYQYEYNTVKYPSSVTAHYGSDGMLETTKLSYK